MTKNEFVCDCNIIHEDRVSNVKKNIPNGKPRFLSSEISSILYSFFTHIIDVYIVPKLNRQTLPIGIKRRDNLRRNPSNNSIKHGLALQRPISNDVLDNL